MRNYWKKYREQEAIQSCWQSGYTLIELLVAVGLFALVMALATGGYLLMIGFNQRAQILTTGIDDLSYALESMVRTIRTGTQYSCGLDLGLGDCQGGGNAFTFSDVNGNKVTYFHVVNGTAKSIQKNVNTLTQNLTSPTPITIDQLTFYVTNTSITDTLQPMVTIVIKGTANGKYPQTFNVQTSVTQRAPDL